MNNEIKIFENAEFGQVRTMTDDRGEPWFVGRDIATALGYANPTKAVINHVEDEDIKSTMMEAESQNGIVVKTKTNFINESGLYSLILCSKLESAKRFKHWVTSDVLPQIRKTGGYIPVRDEDDEKTILSRALLIMKKTIEERNRQLEQKQNLLDEQKPLVEFANAVTACSDSILVRDLAKLIAQNGINIGGTRLWNWMRENGFIYKKGRPKPIQEYVERGIFDVSITVIDTPYGSKERITTKVTTKGQKYFIEGFLSGRFSLIKGKRQ